MTSERPLSQLELTGWRRVLRQGAMVLLVIAAGISAVASLLLPEHDSQLGLLLAPAATILAVAAARSMGHPYPRGLWIGLISAIAGSVMFFLLAATSLTWDGTSPSLDCLIALVGLMAVGGLGGVLLAIEVITHVAERARMRRDVDPVFPTARVVER